ncbi:MAG: hypothetical protein AB7N24_12155 [Dehalococcoidia bacterium]
MRPGTYHLFEIVAWPAAAWCGLELVLRTATGTFDGIAATATTGIFAGLTIVACRLRTTALRTAATVRH